MDPRISATDLVADSERRAGRTIKLVAWGSFLAGLSMVVLIVNRPIQEFTWLSLAFLVGLFSSVLCIFGAISVDIRYSGIVRKLIRQLDEERLFQSVFDPGQRLVDEILGMAALRARNACNAEAKFLNGGLQRWVSEQEDPQVTLGQLYTQYERQRGPLQFAVRETLGEFRRKRDLAQARGYSIHESIKEYSPNPLSKADAQRTDPSDEFVDGRNEFAGQ